MSTESILGFEIDDARAGLFAFQLGKRIAPDVVEAYRRCNRPMCALRKLDVGARVLDVRLMECRVARIRQDLVYAAPEHDYAGTTIQVEHRPETLGRSSFPNACGQIPAFSGAIDSEMEPHPIPTITRLIAALDELPLFFLRLEHAPGAKFSTANG